MSAAFRLMGIESIVALSATYPNDFVTTLTKAVHELLADERFAASLSVLIVASQLFGGVICHAPTKTRLDRNAVAV